MLMWSTQCSKARRRWPRASSHRLTSLATSIRRGGMTAPSRCLRDSRKHGAPSSRVAGWDCRRRNPRAGAGLPSSLSAALMDSLNGANLAFALCPMLSFGAIEALERHGSDELKRDYLPRIVSGEWPATMNLTEPQAGSDVGALKTRAEPNGDGSWRLKGTKIFITYGEHDLADNIIHLVLARTAGAPDGTRGISLFLVPKILPDGARNDLKCVSIEHKMGIHASPTCVLSFGDEGGATGWLVGPEMAGMRAMFTMMNN